MFKIVTVYVHVVCTYKTCVSNKSITELDHDSHSFNLTVYPKLNEVAIITNNNTYCIN